MCGWMAALCGDRASGVELLAGHISSISFSYVIYFIAIRNKKKKSIYLFESTIIQFNSKCIAKRVALNNVGECEHKQQQSNKNSAW